MRVDPLRMMRGAVQTGTPTNTSVVGLYNSSAAPHFINVLTVQSALGFNQPVGFYVTQNRLAQQNTGTVVPLTTGEAPGPGLIDNDDLSSTPPLDSFAQQIGSSTLGLDARYPLAVLRPGWSLVVVNSGAAAPSGISFIWEWMLAEDLLRRNPDVLLEDILAALKG